MLLAEGWNSPRATVCMHLAPTASKRVYQQRVGRVTRRHPGKEAGVVVDFEGPRLDLPVGVRGFLGDVTGLGDGQVGAFAVVFGSAVDVQAHVISFKSMAVE